VLRHPGDLQWLERRRLQAADLFAQGTSKGEVASSWGVGADRNLLVQALARSSAVRGREGQSPWRQSPPPTPGGAVTGVAPAVAW
jgi:hypothetical protein